ncbi:hypothetical protein ERD95_15390 [Enterobacteriaceae bacterium ML5]|nr:hypothetical protein ERD95_15390 [Enterobacteriaceae bacterium ML5]
MSANIEAKSKATGRKEAWVLIARSGKTTDGRYVAAETLIDVANTYNPKLFPSWITFPSLQTPHTLACIAALRVEIEEDETALYALTGEFNFFGKPCAEKALYPCPEIDMKFSLTGKPYLVGIRLSTTPVIKNIPTINHLFK